MIPFKLYKLLLSRPISFLFGKGCIYYPTCSDYFEEAIGKYGVFKGGKIGLIRILSCVSTSKKRYYDPVPENAT